MTRTKLSDRLLPRYTFGEEVFNMVTHIVGGAFGVLVLISCVIVSALSSNIWGVVTSAVYGGSMIMLYTVSSVYHGLRTTVSKKVMQILDHCTIYLLIAGTYTPIVLCAVRPVSPVSAWIVFGVVWGCAALATVFTAIDLKKYRVFSMICYIGMGWCIIFDLGSCLEAVGTDGFLYLLSGGIAYTVGAVLYGFGKKIKYMHSVFHIFVVIGSVLQYVCIIGYVL